MYIQTRSHFALARVCRTSVVYWIEAALTSLWTNRSGRIFDSNCIRSSPTNVNNGTFWGNITRMHSTEKYWLSQRSINVGAFFGWAPVIRSWFQMYNCEIANVSMRSRWEKVANMRFDYIFLWHFRWIWSTWLQWQQVRRECNSVKCTRFRCQRAVKESVNVPEMNNVLTILCSA